VGLSAMALMLVILLTDKVLSPQYLLWLIAVLAAASILDPATWRPFVPWVLLVAAATQVEFPLLYRDLTHHTWPGLLVLTGRDILLAGLLIAPRPRSRSAGSQTRTPRTRAARERAADPPCRSLRQLAPTT
jgi:hypothetical protein